MPALPAMAPAEADALRKERIDFRTTRANKELIERAASVLGRSISDFAVSTLVDAASRVVREHEILTLSARDQMMLAEALLAPPAPPGRLAEAARRYRRRRKRRK
jgi:uncharacterized protein (DUF1778 family)